MSLELKGCLRSNRNADAGDQAALAAGQSAASLQ
jgi:hypothetical protein